MSETDKPSSFALESGIQLCNAVKLHKCLYDRKIRNAKGAMNVAWQMVAQRCNDQVSNCRFRWNTLRKNFTRSYRKSGEESTYYLFPHMRFLIPYLEGADYNDYSPDLGNDEAKKAPSKTKKQNNNEFMDSRETTRSAEDSSSPVVLQKITNDKQLKALNESTPKKKEANENAKLEESKTPEIESNHSDRRLRERKVTKRVVDLDLSDESIYQEKRPRRVMPPRRQSIGGFGGKYYESEKSSSEKSSPETSHTPEDNEISKPEANDTSQNLDIQTETQSNKDADKDNENESKKDTHDDSSFLKKLIKTVDSSNNAESPSKGISVGTQSETAPRTPDDEFLETLKPEMINMNSRQKIRFKQLVYHALMTVFDDRTNFPSENEIIEAAASVGFDFQKTNSSELMLMRELVSLVLAAKTNPEFVENRRFKTPEPAAGYQTSSSSTLAPKPTPTQPTQNVEKQTSPGNVVLKVIPTAQKNIALPMTVSVNGTTNAVNPHHQIQHQLQQIQHRQIMAKANMQPNRQAATLVSKEGEVRRLYRVFPTNSSTITLPAQAPQRTIQSTAGGALPGNIQQRKQTSTISDPLAPNTQQRRQTSTADETQRLNNQQRPPISAPNHSALVPPPQRTQVPPPYTTVAYLPQQRTQSTTITDTLSSTAQQKPVTSNAGTLSFTPKMRAPTSNANLQAASPQKTQPPLVQIPLSNLRPGLKVSPSRNSLPNSNYNGGPPYLSLVNNKVGQTIIQKSAAQVNNVNKTTYTIPPAHGSSVNKSNNMSAASGSGVIKPDNMSPAKSGGVNNSNNMSTMPSAQSAMVAKRGPIKGMARRYSLCGPLPIKNPPTSAQSHLSTMPYNKDNHSLAPMTSIPLAPKRDEMNSLINQQGVSQKVSERHLVPGSAVPGTIVQSKQQMPSLVNPNSAANSSNKANNSKFIPAIIDNCRPRIPEPLPKPIASRADSTSVPEDATDYLTPSEATLLAMAGTVAADDFQSLFDDHIIKHEPVYEI